MVAMLAFGGTFAYFTANADRVTATTTTAVITVSTDVSSNISLSKNNVLPHETILTSADTSQMLYSTEEATRNQIVFMTFSVSVQGSGGSSIDESDTLSLVIDTPDTIHVVSGTGTISAPQAFTASGVTNTNREQHIAFVVPDTVDSFDMTGLQITFTGSAHSDNGEIPTEMGATITINIDVCSIQALHEDGTELDTITAEEAATFWGYYQNRETTY